ncbi:hypothetical protein [Serinicoccus sediminis]|uniref:hypothetical protein n=1 Tax=Serinicoccus sediminis TaxID=2306021 RepID=UPI00101ECBA3|nr:hypothetical protein [Serinicoccus sediminis]
MSSYSTPPPTPDDRAVTLIDCQTCPVRGRHCGDCFVPVLGRLWLDDLAPAPRQAPEPQGRQVPPGGHDPEPRRAGADLDSDELAAVSAFVRAGLVTRQEALATRAEVTPSRRAAAG